LPKLRRVIIDQLELFKNESTQQVIHGDCVEQMKNFPDNHINCVLTDPPYGLKFMNEAWDHGIPGTEYWKELLRICKPGTMGLFFGGARTYHRLTCALEDAGWEIRDCLMWIYGSGFPKSHNKFGLEEYGTALKPAYEPIILAMKPLDGTYSQNVKKWGNGGINIEECRINVSIDDPNHRITSRGNEGCNSMFGMGGHNGNLSNKGRWPANIIFDEETALMLDEQSGTLKSGKIRGNISTKSKNEIYGKSKNSNVNEFDSNSGGASRFFYCAKASSNERSHVNNHPTVKPIKLLEYLLKLIAPPSPLIIDPFLGSGSTLLAAKNLDMNAIGIEKVEEYCYIAKNRLLN
jgi:DNA modification methylase